MKVLETVITETPTSVTFKFILDRNWHASWLKPLYEPGSVVFNKLVEKGFISAEGTTLVQFRFEEAPYRPVPGGYELVFHYFVPSAA